SSESARGFPPSTCGRAPSGRSRSRARPRSASPSTAVASPGQRAEGGEASSKRSSFPHAQAERIRTPGKVFAPWTRQAERPCRASNKARPGDVEEALVRTHSVRLVLLVVTMLAVLAL